MTGSQARSHHEQRAGIAEQDLFAAANEMIQGYLTGRLHRSDTGHLIDELQRLIEERYPNPERLGCPNTEHLAQLTSGRCGCESTIAHVKKCAPCFRKCSDLLHGKTRKDSL